MVNKDVLLADIQEQCALEEMLSCFDVPPVECSELDYVTTYATLYERLVQPTQPVLVLLPNCFVVQFSDLPVVVLLGSLSGPTGEVEPFSLILGEVLKMYSILFTGLIAIMLGGAIGATSVAPVDQCKSLHDYFSLNPTQTAINDKIKSNAVEITDINKNVLETLYGTSFFHAEEDTLKDLVMEFDEFDERMTLTRLKKNGG